MMAAHSQQGLAMRTFTHHATTAPPLCIFSRSPLAASSTRLYHKHLSLNAEYTNTIVDSTTVGGFAVKPESHKARVGLTYRYQSLFGE